MKTNPLKSIFSPLFVKTFFFLLFLRTFFLKKAKPFLKDFLRLTKFEIVIFVLITGGAGYAIGAPLGHPFEVKIFLIFLFGLYFASSGSFALNQAQEQRLDKKMLRTKERPLVKGSISLGRAYFTGFMFCIIGLFLLFLLSPLTFYLSLLTLVTYNGFYTLLWKKKWIFAAVPGALPGALPIVIGYSVYRTNIFSLECAYLFFIMFLWQMPHFWSLALHYKKDYKRGGIPVMPLKLGTDRALYHIGLYVFSYVGFALSAPLFLKVNLFYLFFSIPLALKVIYEFLVYFKAKGHAKAWFPFFLWTNLSLIGFVGLSVLDKWLSSIF